MSIFRNLRRSLRQLTCAHKNHGDYHMVQTRSFGLPFTDGCNRAVGIRACRDCGLVLFDSATSSKAGVPGH